MVVLAVLMVVVAIVVFGAVAFGPRGFADPGRPGASPLVAPAGAALLVGAGDISSCTNDHDELTARLVESMDAQVFAAGDEAYESGSRTEFATCYGPTWGRFRDRTHPVPGNHEYVTPNAAGYFEYFGASVGRPGGSWYAWELNGWRIYALDSNCAFMGGCDARSPEARWLRDDLAAHPAPCVLAMWHHPRFSSGRHGDDAEVQPLWAMLAEAGADIVVSGHDHIYERFAPLDAAGKPDPDHGMREFVVGTGGKELYEFHDIHATSEARSDSTFGVLALTVWPDRFAWHFLPSEGTFTDDGEGTCH